MNRAQRKCLAAFVAEHVPLAFAMLEDKAPNIPEWIAEKFAVIVPRLIELSEFGERDVPTDCVWLSGAQLKGVLSAVPGPEYLEACQYIRAGDTHFVSLNQLLDWIRATNNIPPFEAHEKSPPVHD